MSSVQSVINCPQCGYKNADSIYNCRTTEDMTMCRCCGYHERWDAKTDEEGNFCGWKHEISRGAGALWYRDTGHVAFCGRFFNTQKEVLEAEQWFREALDKGQVDPDVSYLTRWNREAKQVEFRIGKLYEWPDEDESKRTGAPPESSSQPVQPSGPNATAVSPDATDFLDEV